MTDRIVRLAGHEMFVRDVGIGPPVVLCNGIGANVDMWGPLEARLKSHRVISFDAPGTGRSQTKHQPIAMRRLADAVIALLDELGLENADIIGYSFGGAVAQQVALQSPDRVRRLVLAAAFPGWGGVPGRLSAMLSVGTPARYWSRTFYEHTAGAVAGGRARHDRAHVSRLWRERSAQPPTAIGYVGQLWTISTWTSLARLNRITAPTLIVAGDDDPLVPLSNAMLLAERIPDARLWIGEGEGHFLLLDATSSALDAVADFIGASDLDTTDVWATARDVTSDDVARQMRADGIGALPWGPLSAAVRLAVRSPT